jgi:hypothetical protein
MHARLVEPSTIHEHNRLLIVEEDQLKGNQCGVSFRQTAVKG